VAVYAYPCTHKSYIPSQSLIPTV